MGSLGLADAIRSYCIVQNIFNFCNNFKEFLFKKYPVEKLCATFVYYQSFLHIDIIFSIKINEIFITDILSRINYKTA